ncbi:MAG: O-acetylhomoserine (thiol)-lyase [Actinomycetota bacterium]|nr:O-acetylhomoserine (thiol)-lyase [Actinomycetota bacterium]
MPELPQRFDTLKVRAGHRPSEHHYAVQVPIYQTASYELGDPARAERLLCFDEVGFTYSRVGNPTVAALEERVAALDGASGAVALASGMAAVSYALLNVTDGGGRILSTRNLYGGTTDAFKKIFPRFGVEVDYAAEVDDPASFERALRPDTRAIFVESITNPNAVVADLAGLADVAHAHGIPLIVDNTFATPYLLRPIEHGADVVVYSATKGLSGNGSTIAGLVLESGLFDWGDGSFPQFTDPIHTLRDRFGAERGILDITGEFPFTLRLRLTYLAYLGAALGPQDAYLVLLGLETLSERVAKQVATAERVVAHLQAHPDVAWVFHPSAAGSRSADLAARYLPRGAGPVLSFGLHGDPARAEALIAATGLFSYQANVGDARSLIINSARTTHGELDAAEQAAAGIRPETIRLSIGLEDPDDLIDDLDQAIAAAVSALPGTTAG